MRVKWTRNLDGSPAPPSFQANHNSINQDKSDSGCFQTNSDLKINGNSRAMNIVNQPTHQLSSSNGTNSSSIKTVVKMKQSDAYLKKASRKDSLEETKKKKISSLLNIFKINGIKGLKNSGSSDYSSSSSASPVLVLPKKKGLDHYGSYHENRQLFSSDSKRRRRANNLILRNSSVRRSWQQLCAQHEKVSLIGPQPQSLLINGMRSPSLRTPSPVSQRFFGGNGSLSPKVNVRVFATEKPPTNHIIYGPSSVLNADPLFEASCESDSEDGSSSGPLITNQENTVYVLNGTQGSLCKNTSKIGDETISEKLNANKLNNKTKVIPVERDTATRIGDDELVSSKLARCCNCTCDCCDKDLTDSPKLVFRESLDGTIGNNRSKGLLSDDPFVPVSSSGSVSLPSQNDVHEFQFIETNTWDETCMPENFSDESGYSSVERESMETEQTMFKSTASPIRSSDARKLYYGLTSSTLPVKREQMRLPTSEAKSNGHKRQDILSTKLEEQSNGSNGVFELDLNSVNKLECTENGKGYNAPSNAFAPTISDEVIKVTVEQSQVPELVNISTIEESFTRINNKEIGSDSLLQNAEPKSDEIVKKVSELSLKPEKKVKDCSEYKYRIQPRLDFDPKINDNSDPESHSLKKQIQRSLSLENRSTEDDCTDFYGNASSPLVKFDENDEPVATGVRRFFSVPAANDKHIQGILKDTRCFPANGITKNCVPKKVHFAEVQNRKWANHPYMHKGTRISMPQTTTSASFTSSLPSSTLGTSSAETTTTFTTSADSSEIIATVTTSSIITVKDSSPQQAVIKHQNNDVNGNLDEIESETKKDIRCKKITKNPAENNNNNPSLLPTKSSSSTPFSVPHQKSVSSKAITDHPSEVSRNLTSNTNKVTLKSVPSTNAAKFAKKTPGTASARQAITLIPLQKEIERLKKLSEVQRKQLESNKKTMSHSCLVVGGLSVIIRYLNEQLNAFYNPVLNQKLNFINNKCEELELRLTDKDKEIFDLMKNHSAIENELKDEITTWKMELDMEKNRHKNERDKLLDMHELEMNALTEKYATEIRHEKENQTELLSQIDEYKKELIVKNEEIDEIKLRLSELQKSLLNSKDKRVRALVEKVDALSNEVQSLNVVLELKDQKLRTTSHELMTSEQKLEELLGAKQKISSLSQQVEQLTATLSQKIDQYNKVNNAYIELKNRFEKENMEKKRLSLRNEELEYALFTPVKDVTLRKSELFFTPSESPVRPQSCPSASKRKHARPKIDENTFVVPPSPAVRSSKSKSSRIAIGMSESLTEESFKSEKTLQTSIIFDGTRSLETSVEIKRENNSTYICHDPNSTFVGVDGMESLKSDGSYGFTDDGPQSNILNGDFSGPESIHQSMASSPELPNCIVDSGFEDIQGLFK